MKRQQSTILYVFIILLILAGVSLFVFKDTVSNVLLNYDTITPVVNSNRTNNDLKLDILRDSRIKALKNYVSTFRYDDLDKSQEIILNNSGKEGDITISNPDDEATSTVSNQNIIRVRVGNSNPFLTQKVIK